MKTFVTILFIFPATLFANDIWSPKTPSLKTVYSKAIKKSEKISPLALKKAFQFYEKNISKERFRADYMGVVDFTLKSTQKRLALIDLKTGDVELYKVSHGKGSDKNHDTIMDLASSNEGSNATPIGFHKMGETYHGQHGLSVKMHGLESVNKSSLKRLIVLHGAKYVSWPHTGRSKGCPAVENKHTKHIIERLKNGGLFYHYWKK